MITIINYFRTLRAFWRMGRGHWYILRDEPVPYLLWLSKTHIDDLPDGDDARVLVALARAELKQRLVRIELQIKRAQEQL